MSDLPGATSEQSIAALDAFVRFTEAVGTSTDVHDLARHAIDVLMTRFQGASVGYYDWHDPLWKATVLSDNVPPDLERAVRAGLPSDLPIFAEALRTRDAVFVDAWTPEAGGVEHTEGYAAACVYPLVVDGDVRALLSAGLQGQRRWTQRDQALVRAIGRALTLALERAAVTMRLAQQNAELERERIFLRAVLESLNEGIVACDADGQLTLFNDATRRMHGQTEHALPPHAWAGQYDLFEGDGVTPW